MNNPQQDFRPNVGIVVINDYFQVLWGKRAGTNFWQFPQGGIHSYETEEQALWREISEEIALTPNDLEIVYCSSSWHYYYFPKGSLKNNKTENNYIGQKQRWYLLRYLNGQDPIDLAKASDKEFDDLMWVSFWYPLSHIAYFKRHVYRNILTEFSQNCFLKLY